MRQGGNTGLGSPLLTPFQVPPFPLGPGFPILFVIVAASVHTLVLLKLHYAVLVAWLKKTPSPPYALGNEDASFNVLQSSGNPQSGGIHMILSLWSRPVQ